MSPRSGVATLAALYLLMIYKQEAAIPDCSGENCICAWNFKYSPRRQNNGVYRIVDDTQTGTNREWVMDDFTPTSYLNCLSYPEYFWNAAGNGRWYMGSEPNLGGTNGHCFCSASGLQAFTSADCPTGNLYCVSGFSQVQDEDVQIYFGTCPQLSDVCTSLRVTAAAPYDFCNGIYDAIAPPDDLINQMNIFQNRDGTAPNSLLYFDQNQNRWQCANTYKPCTTDFSSQSVRNASYTGTLYYWGGQDDFGTPLWFDDTGGITTSTGQTFTVNSWGEQNDNNGVATFECNPVGPTVDPTSSPSNNPTSVTTTPTGAPTRGTTTESPTKSPTKEPTNLPSKSPTNNPTTADPTTANPTTADPTTASPTTPAPTTVAPTLGPTVPGQTRAPSGSPTTADPTRAVTDTPTANPTRSPLPAGQTHSPTMGNPTTSPTTGEPTGQPSEEPTEYRRQTTTADDTDDQGEDENSFDLSDTANYGAVEYLFIVLMVLLGLCCIFVLICIIWRCVLANGKDPRETDPNAPKHSKVATVEMEEYD